MFSLKEGLLCLKIKERYIIKAGTRFRRSCKSGKLTKIRRKAYDNDDGSKKN